MKKVLITGATGATGGHAIEKLLELKVPVRALVHKVDARSEKLSSQGVEIFQGAYPILRRSVKL
jgi:NAD(P)H dehydrogenase (quinone)